MTEQEIINYISEDNKIVNLDFSLPFDNEEEEQLVGMLISTIMKLEKQGYDIWGHIDISVSFSPKSETDCEEISSFLEKYKECGFLTIQGKALRDILSSSFKSEMIEILQNSNIIYKDELKDINRDFFEIFLIKSIIIRRDITGEDRFSLPISIEQYEEIISIIRRIISDLPKDSEKLKLFEIEQRLASILTVDENDKGDASFESKRSRNLECLLQKKTVCIGAAVALAQTCSLAGIECRVIGSLIEANNQHIYNQVKIDGVWYNTDLMWNIKNYLKYGVMPQFFLLSDKTFQDRCHISQRAYHCTSDASAAKCNTDMFLSMEEVERCTRNLRNWEKSNKQVEIAEDEISIE